MASTVWKGTLTFGLVSIPVRLYRAARAERVKFHHVYRRAETPERAGSPDRPEPLTAEREEEPDCEPETEGETPRPPTAAPVAPVIARAHQAAFSAEENRMVPHSELIKAHEFEPGRYVPVAAPELAKLKPRTSTTMEVIEFVRLDEVDPVYLETSYYVAPDRGAEKPYAVLFDALRETGYAAVAKLAMHGREHVGILRPGQKGLLFHTLYYVNEVRADQEFQARSDLVTPKERELATLFVKALAHPFEPAKFKDTYRENVEALIAGKVRGEPVLETAAEPARPPIIDIMEALRKSLAQIRKPPAPARTGISRTEASARARPRRSKSHRL